MEQLKNDVEQLRVENQMLEAEKAAALAQVSLLQAAHGAVGGAQQTAVNESERLVPEVLHCSSFVFDATPLYASSPGNDKTRPEPAHAHAESGIMLVGLPGLLPVLQRLRQSWLPTAQSKIRM